MEIVFTLSAQEDIAYWKSSGNKQIQNRIKLLLIAIDQNPFHGIGKPEALKHQLSGKWSRRIDREHRIVYSIESSTITVFSLRYHY